MKFADLLPIGSVVLLTGAQKPLMIYGIGQTDETNHKDYDYIGVLYPEGSMGTGSQFLFNHADVDKVLFRGYENEERARFIAALQSVYDKGE